MEKETKHTPGYMQDATKLLLDRIISWEKDLSEYTSLESILRKQFIILERSEDELDNAIVDGTSTPEQDREYLIREGVDPEEIVEKGLVFIKTAMELGSVKHELSEMKKENERLKKENKVIYGSEMVQLSDYQDLKKEREELVNCLQQWLKNVPILDDRYSYIKGELTKKTTDLLIRIKK